MVRTTRSAPARMLLALAFLGCAAAETGGTVDTAENSMKIDSLSFVTSQKIPGKHTCEGDDLSPTLHWSRAPIETKSFVLIVDDPDAPDPAKPGRAWNHWLLYNLPPSTGELGEGITPDRLPSGTKQGKNDWQTTGWRGPCPSTGRHRYVFNIYALDVMLKDLAEPDRKQLEAAMQGHVLAHGQLVGTYEKQKPEPAADPPAPE